MCISEAEKEKRRIKYANLTPEEKAERAAYQREYYKNNTEKVLGYRKAWYKRNAQKLSDEHKAKRLSEGKVWGGSGEKTPDSELEKAGMLRAIEQAPEFREYIRKLLKEYEQDR